MIHVDKIHIKANVKVICVTGLILGLRPVNERQRYFVKTSLIGTAQTYNHPCVRSLVTILNVMA